MTEAEKPEPKLVAMMTDLEKREARQRYDELLPLMRAAQTFALQTWEEHDGCPGKDNLVVVCASAMVAVDMLMHVATCRAADDPKFVNVVREFAERRFEDLTPELVKSIRHLASLAADVGRIADMLDKDVDTNPDHRSNGGAS